MFKKLSLILRILLAMAGMGYIAWTMDWVDKVEVKPGVTLSDGRAIDKVTLLRVVEGEVNPTRQQANLTLADPASGPGAPRVIVTAQDLTDSKFFLLRPSFITTLRHANLGMLIGGLLLVCVIYPLQTYRWLILLRARGLDVTFMQALRLTMVGCFFNYCMPGSTGGDVAKAYYAAKKSDRRTDAVMSVLFDRVAGLIGLALLGGIASLTMLHEPITRQIAIYLWSGMALGAVGAMVYYSRRLRKRLGLDWVIARLPGQKVITKVDQAAVAYRDHKAAVATAVLLSIPVHLAITSSTAIAGYALGMEAPLGRLMTVVPVIFLSGSIPITPQGAGVWELLGRLMLYHPPQVTMNQIVAMLLMVRLYQLGYSLLGSIYLLRGDIHLPSPDRPLDPPQADAKPDPAN